MGIFRKKRPDPFAEQMEKSMMALIGREGFQEAIAADTTITIVPLDGCDVKVDPFDMFYAELGPEDASEPVITLPRLLWEKVLEQDGYRFVAARITSDRVRKLLNDDLRNGVITPLPTSDEDRTLGESRYVMGEGWAVVVVTPDRL